MSMGRSIGTSVLTAVILCLVGVSATAQAWEAYPPITAETTSPTDGQCVVPGSPVSLSADVGDQDRYYGLCDEVWKYFYYDDGDNDGAYVTGWKCNGQTINPPWNSWNAPPATGQNTVTVTANDNAIYANDTPNRTHSHTLWTVGVASISPAGPLTVGKGATVEFTATRTNSSTTPSSPGWPSGKPVWGGTSGASGSGETISVTFNTVSSTTSDYKTVTATCGNTVTVNVVVCEIDKLQYRRGEDAYQDVTSTLFVEKGGSIDFKAIIKPAGATWPSGKPVWGGTSGASGSGETISVTFNTVSSTTSDYKTVTATCGNTVTVNVIVFEVVSLKVDSGLPGDDWDANIPQNATGGTGPYTSQQATVTIDTTPNNIPITLDLGDTSVANFGGAATISISENSPVTLSATTDAKGGYTITPKYNGVQCGSPVPGTVFKILLCCTDSTFSGATTGYGVRTVHKVSHDSGGSVRVQHAARATGQKYASFGTDPAGAYGLYLAAQLTASQSYYSTHDGLSYGVYVFKDSFTLEGDLSISLTYGPVTVTIPMTTNKGAWSAWKGELQIQGPNDAAPGVAPTAQSNADSSRIGFPGGGWDFVDVTTPSTVTTPVNHYQVGNSGSRATLVVEHACSGAIDTTSYESKAEVDLGAAPLARPMVTVEGVLTPTAQSAP